MQTALVTGGSSGIGRATALRLAEQGLGVVATYRGHGAGAAEVVAEIEAGGGSAVALHLDVTDLDSFPDFVERLTATLLDRWQTDRLDVLVNNAGIGFGVPFADVTEEQFDQFHRTLLKGPYFLTQQLLPLLAEGSTIVNTGSTSALPSGTTVGFTAYASQKGAMHTLTRVLAKELAPHVRVNAVAPGSTRTRIAGDAFADMPQADLDRLAGTVALRRVGEADDVGAAIVFLAGPQSG